MGILALFAYGSLAEEQNEVNVIEKFEPTFVPTFPPTTEGSNYVTDDYFFHTDEPDYFHTHTDEPDYFHTDEPDYFHTDEPDYVTDDYNWWTEEPDWFTDEPDYVTGAPEPEGPGIGCLAIPFLRVMKTEVLTEARLIRAAPAYAVKGVAIRRVKALASGMRELRDIIEKRLDQHPGPHGPEIMDHPRPDFHEMIKKREIGRIVDEIHFLIRHPRILIRILDFHADEMDSMARHLARMDPRHIRAILSTAMTHEAIMAFQYITEQIDMEFRCDLPPEPTRGPRPRPTRRPRPRPTGRPRPRPTWRPRPRPTGRPRPRPTGRPRPRPTGRPSPRPTGRPRPSKGPGPSKGP